MEISSLIYARKSRKVWLVAIVIAVIIGGCYIVLQTFIPVIHFVISISEGLNFTEEYFQMVLNESPFFLTADNETGFSDYIVPNIVHFVRINQRYVTFVDLVCLLAAYKHQKPEKIWIHCDECDLQGPYWEKAKNEIPILELKQFQPPTEIFGKKFDNVWHSGDVARIRLLQKYGGIMLDNDVYVVRSLDRFRRFEMTAGWDDDRFIGMQILIAHRKARYLKLWLESYNDYRGDKWYYNAGELPTKSILWKHPEILHRIKKWFGVSVDLSFSLYEEDDIHWHDFYTFHLLLRHIDLPPHIKTFNERNIQSYNTTFGRMARLVYYGSEDLILQQE